MMDSENLKNSIFSGVFWKFAERILAQGVSFIVSVILARILMPSDYGIVALILVFINIANVFVTSGFSTALVQNKEANRIDFSWKSAKSMMSYGWKILAADLSGTFFEQLRSLIVGKAYTSADLAFYNKGNQLPSLITTNISTSIMSVLFPAIANISDEKARVKEMTRKAVKIMSFVMFPMLFGLAAASGPLINVLFTSKWALAVPFVQILSISSAISLIGGVSLQAIKAIGKSDIILKLEVYKKPVYVLLLIIGVKINVTAVAVTMLLYSIYGNVVNAGPLKKEIDYTYREQLKDLSPAFLMSGVMGLLVYMVSYLKLNNVLLLFIQVLVGIALYLGMAMAFEVDTLKYLQNFLKEKMKR